MSELTPDAAINKLDLATFLIDDRISAVRKQLFDSYDNDEETDKHLAQLLRIAYAHGLCDAYVPEIKQQIEDLGYKWPLG